MPGGMLETPIQPKIYYTSEKDVEDDYELEVRPESSDRSVGGEKRVVFVLFAAWCFV